jgi:hypothetical protein
MERRCAPGEMTCILVAPASCRPFRRHPAGDRSRLEGGVTAGWKPALLSLEAKDLELRILRSFAVFAAQDDGV